MKRALKWLGFGLLTVILLAAAGLFAFGDRMQNAEFWESEIEGFESADAARFPDKGQILFTGSSSVRLWSSLAEDMAPMRVVNRGFGGAHMAHVVHFAPRIIRPYEPRAVVVYAGDNDIAAGKTPETVEADFRALVAFVRETQSNVPIYFLTIKPSRLRWNDWPTMLAANRRIEALASADPTIRVIDVSTPMTQLGGGGEPPASLFAFDGLHLSEAGYVLWSGIVRERLLADLGPG